MKRSVIIPAVILGTHFLGGFANACEQPEAQLIATISKVEKTYPTCIAKVKPEDIRFFAASYVCPLQIDELLSEGVSVGLMNGHDCQLNVGDELNGIVFKGRNGTIFID